MSALLIFVDGLSYSMAKCNLSVLKDKKIYPITPGVGFSNNLYPEMLCGKTPDEIGYFNEWSPVQERRSPVPFFLRLADIFRNSLYINAGFRKIFLRRMLGLEFSNIPFKYAHFFAPAGSHNFRDLKGGVLKDYSFDIYDAVEMSAPVGKRDIKAIEQARGSMRNVNTLVSLVDLDNIAHIHGLNSKEFAGHIQVLDEEITSLVSEFRKLDAKADILIFSDHGMADVDRSVYLDIESVAGEMAHGKYLYFIDSTFLRVWTSDSGIKESILAYLGSLDYGDILTNEEREFFGITKTEFGEIIFRAREGVLLLPNFYGARHVKAMHGYDSTLASQTAFLAEVEGVNLSTVHPLRSRDIYKFLSENLSRQTQ